jgi:hypothetical protein
MKKQSLSLLLVLAFVLMPRLQAQSPSPDFTTQGLRLELYFCGNAKMQTITMGRMVQDPIWGGPSQAVSPLDQGAFVAELFDAADQRLLYRRGFDCLFAEYLTTEAAMNGMAKTFEHSLSLPFPRRPVRLVLSRRDRQQALHPVLERVIDPLDYHIHTRMPGKETVFIIQEKGAPEQKVDLLFIAEGYTPEEQEKFRRDAERFTRVLFETEPYTRHHEDFNVRALFLPSAESGVDEPRQQKYRETALDASFNALDLDRYLLTEAGHTLGHMAGSVPRDSLVILVNSSRYGGGGIYNDYAVTTVDHDLSHKVFVHEFGHSFAGLADEYYTSDVAYNEFYPKGLEPLEPNITALLDPAGLKWKNLVNPGTPLPTPWGKAEREALQQKLRDLRGQREAAMKEAGEDTSKQKKVRTRFDRLQNQLSKKLKGIEKKFAAVENQVGAFEGAGYASLGLYRPMVHCLMHSNQKGAFCRVCQEAIRRSIDYYCGRN